MWVYRNKILNSIPEKAVGFVYIIRRINLEDDNSSPLFYIGKKGFYSRAGKKTIESNWREYYGSSDNLKEDIEKYGKDNFEREILRLCYSKTEMSFYETMYLFKEEVLRVDIDSVMPKKYYNYNIMGKFYKMRDFSSDETKYSKEYFSSDDKILLNVTNGMYTKQVKIKIEYYDEWLENNPGWYCGTSYSSPKEKWLENIIIGDYKKIHIHNKSTGTIKCLLEKQLDKFLELNPGYEVGKEYVSKPKTIYAIDIRNNKKIMVEKNEYKNNEYLVSPNTKKVKIKSKNRIVFEGYLKLFLMNNPDIPSHLFEKALKTEKGEIFVKTGKNIWINERKYIITEK